MVCAECGRDVVQAKTGRPRKYCSRSCQARGYRRRRDEGRLSAAAAAISSGGASPSLIDAAISMADTRGIRALTLRTLARDRGIAMSALQHDLGSRDRLVALMVQQIFRESTSQSRSQDGEDAPVDEEPVDALLRSADEEWQAYRAHPWLVEVMTTTRPPLVPAVLASVQAVIGTFMRVGLDSGEAFNRYLALSAYVQGMATLLTAERQESDRTGTSYRSWWLDQFRAMGRSGATTRHPWLTELSATRSQESFHADAAFYDGLPRIVHGLVTSD
ncbi:transcriptional regulator, TetR family [Brevibacterium sp. Mu109]|nr:transcriptional regulator, TetR family [Brevibacterium sp. Mu109]